MQEQYRLGIIGGGQLAKMMAIAARGWGWPVTILNVTLDCPAGQVANRVIPGSYSDEAAMRQLFEVCDLVTCDLEGIDAELLAKFETEGHTIHPSARVLKLIQDKYLQKTFLADQGLPVPRFDQSDDPSLEDVKAFGLPAFQKLRHGGYDGRGVKLLGKDSTADELLPGATLLEECVAIKSELAVLVARGTSMSNVAVAYPPVEMFFNPTTHTLNYLCAPAALPSPLVKEITELAIRTIIALDGYGIFAVEFFLTEENQLLINEIAPRPHNSGHFTIEASATSQFQQHLRAIAGFPLGSTSQLFPAAMVNLLGSLEGSGPPVVKGLRAGLEQHGTYVHIYGKDQTRPGRKMGHVTVVADNCLAAKEQALRVRDLISIEPEA